VPLRLDKTLIADLPLFEGFEPSALEDVLERAHAVHYPKGKVVFSQNENAQSFFLLLHGRLRVTQVTPTGEQIVVRFVNPGDLFGIALAIGRTTYPGTATAAADSLALVWPSAAWPEIMAAHPSLAANAMRMVGSRLQEAHQRVRELSTEDVERTYLSGLVHDIGKIGLPASLLNKEGRLTLEEFREMERHSEIGERILSKVEAYADVAIIVRHHHERMDGEGYPDKIRGEAIPLISRIIAVADAYNAMTSDRPYRAAMEYLVARDRLLQAMGSQFYTEAVVAFLSILATANPAYRAARGPGFGTVLASTMDGEESSSVSAAADVA